MAAVVWMKTELRIRLETRVALELEWCKVRDKIAVTVRMKVQRKYSRITAILRRVMMMFKPAVLKVLKTPRCPCSWTSSSSLHIGELWKIMSRNFRSSNACRPRRMFMWNSSRLAGWRPLPSFS